jgi:hypothetical protein
VFVGAADLQQAVFRVSYSVGSMGRLMTDTLPLAPDAIPLLIEWAPRTGSASGATGRRR